MSAEHTEFVEASYEHIQKFKSLVESLSLAVNTGIFPPEEAQEILLGFTRPRLTLEAV